MSNEFDLNGLSEMLKNRVDQHAGEIYSKTLDDIENWFFSDWEENFKIYVERQAQVIVKDLLQGKKSVFELMPVLVFEDFFKKLVKASESDVIKNQQDRIKLLEKENEFLKKNWR